MWRCKRRCREIKRYLTNTHHCSFGISHCIFTANGLRNGYLLSRPAVFTFTVKSLFSMRGALLQLLLFPLVLVPVLHAAPVVNRLRSLSALLENVADRELPMPPELKSQLEQLGHTLRQELNQADELGLTRVHRSVIEQDIDRLDALLRAGADYERPAGELNVIPLHLSVLAGDQRTACLERLLREGASVDKADAKGTTALHAASTLNLPHVCTLLLEAGAKPERRGRKGVRPLHLAAWSNAAEAAEVLLRHGASVEGIDKKKRTACHAAAAADAPEALEVLLDGGANVERPDARGRRALHYATTCCRCADPACRRVRALQLLLDHGVEVDARDAGGWSALDVAAEHNRVAPLRLLLSRGADANGGYAPRRPTEGAGAAPLERRGGCPPIILAAHAGACEATATLLAAGALIDAPDAFGATALHASAVGAQLKTLQFLVQAGAAIDVVDDAGRSAAHYAARSGSVACLRALREAGVDMVRPTHFGWTPLHVAANHSHPAALAALLSLGGSQSKPSQADAVGWTPLHLAAHRLGEGTNGCRCSRCVKLHERRLECVRTLLGARASTAAADARGATPGHLAAAHDDVEGLRLLRHANPPDLWLADYDGRRPIDVARRMHQPSKFVRELLLLGDECASNAFRGAGEEAGEETAAKGEDN